MAKRRLIDSGCRRVSEFMDRERKFLCGKGMHPAAVRLINKELARLGRPLLAPHERDAVAISVVLEELAKLQELPTPTDPAPLFAGAPHV